MVLIGTLLQIGEPSQRLTFPLRGITSVNGQNVSIQVSESTSCTHYSIAPQIWICDYSKASEDDMQYLIVTVCKIREVFSEATLA